MGEATVYVVEGDVWRGGNMAVLPGGTRAGLVACGGAYYVPLELLWRAVGDLGGAAKVSTNGGISITIK